VGCGGGVEAKNTAPASDGEASSLSFVAPGASTQAVPDPPAACASTPGELVRYRTRVLDWETNLAPAALEVRACERADTECRLPLQLTGVTVEGEQLEFVVPRGFADLLQFRAPGFNRTLLWLPHPLCQDERAALPVWLLKPVLNRRSDLTNGFHVASNRLLLQQVDCVGAVRSFPVDDAAGVIRVSPAGAAAGQRMFTNILGQTLLAEGQDEPTDPFDDVSAPLDVEGLTGFYDLPAQEDLALEVFDYLNRYDVLYLRMSERETGIASVFLSDCSGRGHAPH
jgi:hypothetical protein